MNTSLREIVLSVRYGDAALVGESAGYLVLGVADLLSEMPRAASLDSIAVAEDGSVSIDASPCTFQESEASLRRLLGLLLQLVRTPCKNLDRVAQRPETRGILCLIAELESALVPVNRKAARRSLARLVRESKKASARMAALASVEPKTYQASRIETSRIETSSQDARQSSEIEASGECFSQKRTLASELEESQFIASTSLAASLPEVLLENSPVELDDADAEDAEFDDVSSHLPTAAAPSATVRPQAPVAIVEKQSELHDAFRLSQPPVVGVQVTGRRASLPVQGAGADFRALSFLAREYPAQTPSSCLVVESLPEGAVPEDNWAIDLSPVPAPMVTPPSASASAVAVCATLATFDSFVPQEGGEYFDELDAAPTQIFSGALEVEAVTTVPPTAMRADPAKVFESPVRPLSTRARPPLADDVALVPASAGAPIRRPSDINELLNRMSIAPEPDDELYAGLKMLSRIELSPLAPPVGVDWIPNKIKAS